MEKSPVPQVGVIQILDYGLKIEGGWFKEDGHLYRDEQGLIVPSSTQVFDILGCTDFGDARPEDVAWKRSYGNETHRAVEALVRKELDWDSLDDSIAPAVEGVSEFLHRIEFEYQSAEERKIRNLCGMKFGTTLDLRGTFIYHGQRRHAILDVKTGSKFSKTWEWQLGSYFTGQAKVPGGWIGIALQVDKDGQVKSHFVIDLVRARDEFQTLLAAANLKLNNGMAKILKAA